MAVTFSIVKASPNHMRYLATATGAETGVLTCSGAATPDVQTDAPGGQLKTISKTVANGYGKLAAGALNQAQARALWASDDPTNLVGTNMPLAISTITPRSAITANLDLNVSGGNPTFNITFSGAGSVYLDIYMPGGIGQ
jgi:hypothetical protein